MTATLINMIAAPAVAELTGLTSQPGVPTGQGPPAAVQSGATRSFATAMATLENPHSDAVSSTLLRSDLAVTATATAAPITVLDLGLSVSLEAIATGEQPADLNPIDGLPNPLLNLDESTGKSLPDTGTEIGKLLPDAAGQPATPSVTANGGAAASVASNLIVQQQAAIDSTQLFPADITSRPVVADSRLQTDAGVTTRTSTPADDPSELLPRDTGSLKPALEFDLNSSGQTRRAFELPTMPAEQAVAGRAAVAVAGATLTVDAGPVGFAQSASAAALQFGQAMELPQFQNMRPLQPMVDSQAFTNGLHQRLMVMSEEGVQSARMKLYPENLGSLDIRIRIEDDTARVWFTAQHGQAREALEAALPKLKDMFAQQGMELIQADVGSGQEQHDGAEVFDGADDRHPGSLVGEPDFVNDGIGQPGIITLSDGSLDIYV